MTVAKIPSNEEARINTLVGLNILDTPAEDRFDRYTRLAQRMFNTPVAIIGLTDVSRQWFKSARGCGDVTEVPRDIAFCAHTILEDDILEVPDARNDERFRDNPMVEAEDGLRFYAGAPLVVSGCNIGTLCITDNKPRSLTDEERTSFRDFASMVSDEFIAYIDPLTGLANRSGYRLACSGVMNKWQDGDQSACTVLLDIDKFKSINDKFGHHEGDQALVNFADIMKTVFRDSDTVARLGGDEFAVLLSNCNMAVASKCVTRLEQETALFNKESGLPYELKFSSGIAEFDPRRDRSIHDLLHHADKEMYRSKNSKSAASSQLVHEESCA